MKMKENTKRLLYGFGFLALLILAMFGGCKLGQRNCPKVVEVERDTFYIATTDTFNITSPSRVKVLNHTDTIKIKSEEQLDSLKRATEALIAAKELELNFYRESYNALKEAKAGDVVLIEPPHVVFEGEKLSQDGTAKIKYSIELKDSLAWVNGTEQKPNPRFFVESIERHIVETQTIETKGRNAIGVGGAVSYLGGKADAAPLLKLRVGKTEGFVGYFVNGKAVIVGATKEFQFVKNK